MAALNHIHNLDLSNSDAIIISAFSSVQQSRDGAAPFLQEANFLWLTGINHPDWKVVVMKNESILVSPERSSGYELFEGGISDQEALSLSGATRLIDSAKYEELLIRLASEGKTAYTLGPDPQAKYYDFELNPAPVDLRKKLVDIFGAVDDIRPKLARLRAIKSADELDIIRRAVAHTTAAFKRAKTELQFATYEYELEASMTHEVRSKGATGHAYEPIVASGKNALTLHYSSNNAQLPKNGLVLVDVGARVGDYAADVTRTYAKGTPSEREAAVHAAVETAHARIISLIKPGVSFKDYQVQTDKIMKQALGNLGLLNEPGDYRKYFPHAISHGLGIDVHESLGGYETFQPGMVLTVEPGIYIPEEGVGVRIEDDILVTPDGNDNLSGDLPTSL